MLWREGVPAVATRTQRTYSIGLTRGVSRCESSSHLRFCIGLAALFSPCSRSSLATPSPPVGTPSVLRYYFFYHTYMYVCMWVYLGVNPSLTYACAYALPGCLRPPLPSPVAPPPSVSSCYFVYYTYNVCIYVCGYTSGSIAISLTRVHRLGRAVFALLSLLPRHSPASRRAPLNIEPRLLLLYIYVCSYVGVTRC